ncbi:MAG TPA: OmpA family protein [Pseudobdellovibrionaceae bacterium]|nr:OmpA family protein [Pseudobdellovibrionaceae bacterium]
MKTRLLYLFLVLIFFTDSQLKANVIGPDTQNFNPTTNGLDFVTVESSETLDAGILNIGYFFNYARNSLPRMVYKSNSQKTDFQDALISGDLSFGLGLTKKWDIGLSFALLHSQEIHDQQGSQIGYFSVLGLNEIRINSKYQLWGDDTQGVALQVLANFNRIENNPYAGRGGSPTYAFMLIGDKSLANFALGFNLGYRKRSPGTIYSELPILIEPFKDTYVASIAASYLIQRYDTKIISEIYASNPAQSYQYLFDREAASMEFILGLKHDIHHKLSFHTGLGAKMLYGSNTPDQRVYAGLNYNIGPLWEPKSIKVKDQVIKQNEITTFVLGAVVFDSAEIMPTEESYSSIEDLGNYLKENTNFKLVTIQGHTDSIGNYKNNMTLSQKRADQIRKILITDFGIPEQKIKSEGKGSDFPIADNGNYQGRLSNRRVEVQIEW